MFGQESKIKVAVLEERVKIHEEMVERVDAAITTLSETNQNICKMLAVHDERITVQGKVDDDICKKVEDIESRIDGLYKFRWQIGGVIAVAAVLVGFLPTVVSTLTPTPTPATIERTK